MTEVVAALILDEHGRLLACRRPEGKHLGGKWEFPGGKVEGAEERPAALARELAEELGIEVEVGAALTSVTWDYGSIRIRLHPFICRILQGEPYPIEHSEIRWTPPSELTALDWAAADEPIVAEFLEVFQIRSPGTP